MIKIFSLFVTNQCNKNCNYCFIQKRNTKFCINKLKYIDYNKYDYISILGGEPGILSFNEIESLFSSLSYIPNNKILIVTNGLFLDRYYKLYDMFNYSYHITDLTNYKLYTEKNVQNLLVATKNNLKHLTKILSDNPTTLFQVVQNIFEPTLILNKEFRQIVKRSNVIFNGKTKFVSCEELELFK